MKKEEKLLCAPRAAHIAAVIMQRDGLCRYEQLDRCRRVYPPREKDCVACLERWIYTRARQELRKEGKLPKTPPQELLGLGDTVWMRWWDDDLKRMEISPIRVTGLGYQGFWYSGTPAVPNAMEAMVSWGRFGRDCFFTRQEAEASLTAAEDAKEESL